MDMNFLEQYSENTVVMKYIKQLQKLYENKDVGLFNDVYKPMIDRSMDSKSLFLSVIIRTQGKRTDGLREALLCMNAQEDFNYEIILIGHKMNQQQTDAVEEILSDQDPVFRAKIRFFRLDTGTRTAPLNFGFAHARGQYAAIFDDDDILFSNWVSSFYECAKENNGRILHSFAFSQEWRQIPELGYRAETYPLSNYCVKFDLLRQFTINRCPLMTLAFPVNMFQEMGIIFNEDLDVTEDWDYFMRLAFLCGVSDTNEPTAIYRFWQNIETSATLHQQETWDETYHAIQQSFNSMNIILPQSYAEKVIDLINQNVNKSCISETCMPLSRFYYSKGASFCDSNCIKASSEASYPNFDLWFLFPEKYSDLTAMRFDLCEEGLFIIDELNIIVWFTNGEKREVSVHECIHNGISYMNSILFLHEDPEIVWEWNDSRRVDVVHISGKTSRSLQRTKWLSHLESLIMRKEKKARKELREKGYF